MSKIDLAIDQNSKTGWANCSSSAVRRRSRTGLISYVSSRRIWRVACGRTLDIYDRRMSYDGDDPLRTADCELCGLGWAWGHCLRLIGLSHLPDFIKHLNKSHSLLSAAASSLKVPGTRPPDGFGSQASSGQLIAYKYCDSRPEAVIKLLGRSVDRAIGCPD